jgi:hypothetical protein
MSFIRSLKLVITALESLGLTVLSVWILQQQNPPRFHHSFAYLPLVLFLLYLFFISSFIYLFDKYCVKLAANVNMKYTPPTAIKIYISFLNLDIFFIHSFTLLPLEQLVFFPSLLSALLPGIT